MPGCRKCPVNMCSLERSRAWQRSGCGKTIPWLIRLLSCLARGWCMRDVVHVRAAWTTVSPWGAPSGRLHWSSALCSWLPRSRNLLLACVLPLSNSSINTKHHEVSEMGEEMNLGVKQTWVWMPAVPLFFLWLFFFFLYKWFNFSELQFPHLHMGRESSLLCPTMMRIERCGSWFLCVNLPGPQWSDIWPNNILTVSERVIFVDEVNIEIGGLRVDQMALPNGRGLCATSWRSEQNQDWPPLSRGNSASRQPSDLTCTISSPGSPAHWPTLQILRLPVSTSQKPTPYIEKKKYQHVIIPKYMDLIYVISIPYKCLTYRISIIYIICEILYFTYMRYTYHLYGIYYVCIYI